MKYLLAILAGFFVFYFISEVELRKIKSQYKSIGSIADLNGNKLHYLDIDEDPTTDKVVLFIHGASSNLNDHYNLFAFRKVGPPLSERARLIFVDRPGHGYSDFEGAETPELQAKRYVELLDHLGIKKVILASHSMGSVSAIAMALQAPSRVEGIMLMAPVGYPEPNAVRWFHKLAVTPVLGPIFAKTLVVPFRKTFIKNGMVEIFYPQIISRYFETHSGMELELRPHSFQNNAQEVVSLAEQTINLSKRYGDISQKVVIVAGTADAIVDYSAQAEKLAKNIPRAKSIILQGVGHKPEYQRKELIMDEILNLGE